MSDLLDRLPYAQFLGLTTTSEGQALTVTMPFAQKLIGNPILPALHGGSTAALLELTAVARSPPCIPGCACPGRSMSPWPICARADRSMSTPAPESARPDAGSPMCWPRRGRKTRPNPSRRSPHIS